MSIHRINHDAIAQGVSAFILNWPSEVEQPNSVPRGAHSVLWTDDFWRGVDMAREALRDTFGHTAWDAWHGDHNHPPPPHTRATIYTVACRMTHGEVTKTTAEAADHDLVETLEEALANICGTGDADQGNILADECDLEVAADVWVEA